MISAFKHIRLSGFNLLPQSVNGQTKTFTYTSGVLTRLDYVNSGVTIRKTFNYTSGILTSIAQVTL